MLTNFSNIFMFPDLDRSWDHLLRGEFQKEYMERLKQFLEAERRSGQRIFPDAGDIFNAFRFTSARQLKAVIIGQDPYHGPGQAHGLAFSVKKPLPAPPSLKNIFKELNSDIPGFTMPSHGDLTSWARQGVLLLNATLTVRAGSPGSHQGKGWENFTDSVIRDISAGGEGLAFLLWGKFAQSKAELIDGKRHLVLSAAHPSPFSANMGFFGCRHFSRANEYLLSQKKAPVDWRLG